MPNEPQPAEPSAPGTERAAGAAVDEVLPVIRDLLAQTFVAGVAHGIEIATRGT